MTRRPILANRIDAALRVCGFLLGGGWLGATTVNAATLLSSEQAVTSVQPLSSSYFAPAVGRQGPIAQPLGAASGATAAPAPTVERTEAPEVRRSANTDSGEPRVRRPKAKPQREKRPKVRREQPEPEAETTPEREQSPSIERKPVPEFESTGEPDYKTPTVLATTAKDLLNVEFGWGWYNEYYFRGVNILKGVSSERTTSGVFTARAALAYVRQNDAFTIGFNYWQALGRQQPKGGEFNVPPNKKDPRIKGAKVDSKFSLPSRDRYAEYNLNLAYTRTLIPGQLTGTVGFNRYQFSNGEFYKTGDGRAITHADETVVKLTYIGMKYLTPSLSWASDIDGFTGNFFEFRVDSNFVLPLKGGPSVAIRPYTSLSYDMDYNGANNGFNSFEFGADLPIQLTGALTLTFTANYVKALEDSEGFGRAKDGFWGGVSLSASWGGPQAEILANYDKSAKKVVMAEDQDHPWEVTLGAGYQKVDYGFNHGKIAPFPVRGIFDPRPSLTGTGFANPGVNRFYDDGFVGGTFTTNPQTQAPGLLPAIITSPFQIQGQPGQNAFARFSASTFAYSTQDAEASGLSDDNDSVVSPTIKFDREILKKGAWTLRGGFSYNFLSSSGDSGYSLARLDSLLQTQTRVGYDYPLDNVAIALGFGTASNGTLQVVGDPVRYANFLQANGLVGPATAAFLRQLTPQTELEKTQQEVVRVGSFVRSSVELEAHELAIPFSVRYDFGNRLHAQVSVAPTITLADVESKTEVSQRRLDDFPKAQTNVLKRGFVPPGRIVLGTAGGLLPAVTPVLPQFLPPPIPPTPVTPVAGGGKGATPQSPDFPGKSVGNLKYSQSSLDALFGVKGQASLIFDLNDEKTIFAELWGGYHWVQDLNVSNGFGEASIEMSSFQAGLSLGFRF